MQVKIVHATEKGGWKVIGRNETVNTNLQIEIEDGQFEQVCEQRWSNYKYEKMVMEYGKKQLSMPQFYRKMEDGMRRWQNMNGKTKFVPFSKESGEKSGKRQKAQKEFLVTPLAINQLFAAVLVDNGSEKTLHIRKLCRLKTLPPWEDTEMTIAAYRCSQMWLDELWVVEGSTIFCLDCTRKVTKASLDLSDACNDSLITSISVTLQFVVVCVRKVGVILLKREKISSLEENLSVQEMIEVDVSVVDLHMRVVMVGTEHMIQLYEISRVGTEDTFFLNMIFEEEMFYDYRLDSGGEVKMQNSTALGVYRRGAQLAAFNKNAFVMKDFHPEKQIACAFNDLGTLSAMCGFGELFAVANIEGQVMITEFASGKAHYVKHELGLLARDSRNTDIEVTFPINRQLLALSPNVLYVLLPNGTLVFVSHSAWE